MGEHNIQVSIVMPVYNVAKYLRQCLDSLFSQTLEDIEIIAVNDGSTDNSPQILEEYKRIYPQILSIYTTVNKGVSHARNYGKDRAVGEYILFVDSDDYIEAEMCEKLYNKAIKDNNDIVICGRYNFYENHRTGQVKQEIIIPEMINRNFNLYEDKYELAHILPFPWDKLFKRELLQGMDFPLNIRFEDIVFSYEVVVKAQNIGVLYEPLYNYRKTAQGGFLNSFSEQTLDIVTAFELLIDYMKENNYFEFFHDELEFICSRHFLYRYISLFKDEHKGKGKLDIKLEIINRTQDFLKKTFPGWRENHYLHYSSGWLRKRLPLFMDHKKMVRITKIREYTPNRLYNLIKHLRDFGKGVLRKLNKFRRSRSKLAMIKKKLPFLSVLLQKGSVYYTHLYEKLAVDDRLILLESKHGEDVAGNIFAFLKELSKNEYDDYKVLLAMVPEYKKKYKTLLSRYDINNVNMIDIFSKDYGEALATAKYLVTDTSFPPYYIKKKDQVYLNTWHGTPLKAMGRIVPKREYALGNIQRNFLIADYLLYQNDFSRDVFLKDYMIKDIYPGQVLLSGYPRNSIFFNKLRRDIVRKECAIADKQVIVYMPTWRGLLYHKETDKQLREIAMYFAEIDEGLSASQVFYVKLHPYVKDKMDYSGYRHIREFPSEYETYDFLNASDALVTDYSSIMFDYGVTKNKIVLFAYDKDEYLRDRGLYLKLDDLGLPIAETADELLAEIGKPVTEYKKFHDKFCNYDSGDTPARVMDILLNGQSETPEHTKIETVFNKDKKTSKDDIKLISKVDDKDIHDNIGYERRETVLIYIKGFKKDIESPKRLEMINSIDRDKYDVYVCMKTEEVKKNTGILSQLNKDINYFPLLYDINYTRTDYFICKLIGKLSGHGKSFSKRADKVMKREKQKYFGDVTFDYVIHQSCQDKMVGHLCLHLGEEVIYNFSYFNPGLIKQKGNFSKTIQYFMKLFPRYDWIVIGNGGKGLKLKGDNIIYAQDSLTQANEILERITSRNKDTKNRDINNRAIINKDASDRDKIEKEVIEKETIDRDASVEDSINEDLRDRDNKYNKPDSRDNNEERRG